MSPQLLSVVASVDKTGKINIPVHIAEKIPWRNAALSVEAWLLVLRPGRCRLISRDDLERSPKLKSILEEVYGANGTDSTSDPAEPESSAKAVSRATIIPVTLSFTKGPGWRLFISTHSYPMANFVDKEKKQVLLLLSEGYLEVWSMELMNRVLEESSFEHTP